MRRLTITLRNTARCEAHKSLIKRGLLHPLDTDFMGPVFEGWVWKRFEGGFLCVTLYKEQHDCANHKAPIAEYWYPVSDIARIKWEDNAG